MRPSWDDYFMEIAQVVAKRSTCLRRQVGALLVKDKRILTTGYNGPPSGLAHCSEVGCIRQKNNVPPGQRHELCRAVHAEQNLIAQAALHGISVQRADVYCTHYPCSLCAKMLINVKVKRVIVLNHYPDELASKLFEEAGIEVIYLE